MEQINSKNFDEITKHEGLNIVMFSAPWCGSCSAMKPQLNRFNDDNQSFNIYEISVDDDSDFAMNLGVRSLPAFGFYKEGRQLELKSGYNYMSLKRRIQELID